MQPHASATSENNSKPCDFLHGNLQTHTQKKKTAITIPRERIEQKKMTCAFWDLDKCIVVRIDAPAYSLMVEKAL